MKNVWKYIVAIFSTIGAVLLFVLSGKKTPSLSTAEKLLHGDDGLVEAIKDIQSKPTKEILAEATPRQKEIIDDAVDSTVKAAMKDAAAFKKSTL